MKPSLDEALIRGPTAREYWRAFYMLYRLTSRQNISSDARTALWILVPNSEWFGRCLNLMQQSDCSWLEFSWAKSPELRQLFKPKLGPAAEHIYPWESNAEA